MKSIHHNAVTLDEIVLVSKFESDKTQKICDDNFDSLKSRFRGSKTITLKKEEYWVIVPSGQTSGISAIPYQEQISRVLGFEEDIVENPTEKQEPETMNANTVFKIINSTYMSEEQKADIASVIPTLMCDPLFKVIPAKELLHIFNSKTPVDQEIESMLYTINVMLEVLGTSLDPKRENKQFFDTHWRALNKQKAKPFLFVYSAIFDKFTANMDILEVTFPQARKVDELVSRIKSGLQTIKEEVNRVPDTPPTAPSRQDIYDVIVADEETDFNETNDEQTAGVNSNSNENPSPLQQTQTVGGDNSNSTSANVPTTGNDMSISEPFKQLSAQNQQNTEKIEQSVKEETDAIKKDLNEMKTSVASDFTEIWKDFGNLKEDCESKAPRNFRNGYITGTKTTSTD